jgi:hypothetical protein
VSNTLSDRTTTEIEDRPSAREEIRWVIGCRIHSLGESLVKLGDWIHGDAPIDLEVAWKLGNAMGRRDALKAIDMDEVFNTGAKK